MLHTKWRDHQHEIPSLQPRRGVAQFVEREVVENIHPQRQQHERMNGLTDAFDVPPILGHVAAD